MVFISYWGSSYTTSDIQRFDNHCESHSALEVVYNAPIAISYSVTGTLVKFSKKTSFINSGLRMVFAV